MAAAPNTLALIQTARQQLSSLSQLVLANGGPADNSANVTASALAATLVTGITQIQTNINLGGNIDLQQGLGQ